MWWRNRIDATLSLADLFATVAGMVGVPLEDGVAEVRRVVKKQIIKTALCAAASLLALNTFATASRPDIILIMTDDQGYGDLGCLPGKPSCRPGCLIKKARPTVPVSSTSRHFKDKTTGTITLAVRR